MKNILLPFIFPITSIVPTAPASTAFLRQVAIVVKPKTGVTAGQVVECTTSSQITALTDNAEAATAFTSGLTRVFVVVNDDLDLADLLEEYGQEFFTLLISSDFTEANVTGIAVGSWKGVIGSSSDDEAFLATQAAIENRVGFFAKTATGARNMIYAFGKMLSAATDWSSQQYISMPNTDDIDVLGEADGLWDDFVSFVITDKQYANRLSLFAAGGKAIIAPYVQKNLEIDLQSKALSYISANQPAYTHVQASLLQDELQKVIDLYVTRGWISSGSIKITLENENFVATARMSVPEAKSMWRIKGTVTVAAE